MKRTFSIHAYEEGKKIGLQYHIIDMDKGQEYGTRMNATTIELCPGY